eukprot:406007-Amphidinium_carterae.1
MAQTFGATPHMGTSTVKNLHVPTMIDAGSRYLMTRTEGVHKTPKETIQDEETQESQSQVEG